MKKIAAILAFVGVVVMSGIFAMQPVSAAEEPQTIYLFGRDDCGFCKAEKEFLESHEIRWKYLNVTEDYEAATLFKRVVEKHNLAKVTPLTIVGGKVIQGFNDPETTGKRILTAFEEEKESQIRTIEDHILMAPTQSIAVESGCDENGIECESSEGQAYVFKLPVLGLVNLKALSLFSLSALLGVIDGFNPCAMWVLITFLVLLTQAGSKRKMIFLAGIFIIAEAVMYNLILNVWYKAWDFVALDQIVTPLVGFLALAGGTFFLYRWRKNKDVALVCDITNIDQQTKTINKLKQVISQPLTLTTIAAILVIAFSVNIIEFACSVGIPQAYTKILELNALSFFDRQWYLFIYTLGYMVDDFIVFGLAIWGFSKLEAHGHKYAQLSLLIGGVLMVLLGLILVVNPSLLVL